MNANAKLSLNLIREILAEATRASAHWILVASLLIPTPNAFAREDIRGTIAAANVSIDNKMAKLTSLVKKLESLPEDSAARKSVKAEAHQLARELSTEIYEELAPIKAELDISAEKYKKKEYPGVDQDFVRLWDQYDQGNRLQGTQDRLAELTGRAGLSIQGKFLINPNEKPEGANIGLAEVIPQIGKKEDVAKETPSRINESLKAWGAIGYRGAKHFSVQYATFSMAMGIMALSQLGAQRYGLVETTDPAALENWEKQTFNLIGAVGFGFFMMANHPIVNAYKSLRQARALKMIPDKVLGGLLSNLGMSAGMVAQSIFQDVWYDQDVWSCIRPYYNSRTTPVKDACEKMRHTWLDSGKFLGYTPSILSMLIATPIAAYARSAIAATGVFNPVKKFFVRVGFAGGILVHKSKLGQLAMHGVVAIPGAFIAVGDFVLFLAISAKVTDEHVHDALMDVRHNRFDANAWMAKTLDWHSDFFWPTGKDYQPFANALEVEATNAYSAHNYLMDFYRQMQATGWKSPAPVSACVPKDIAEAAKKDDPAAAKDKWFFQNWWERSSRKKSQRQLTCEVFAHPTELIERYAKVNSEWRGVLMYPFATSVNNWIEMINQFTTVMNASRTLGMHLAQEKYNVTYKNQAAPDLSRAALAKAIGTELPSDDPNAEQPLRVHSSFLDGSWVPTPELVDYVIAGFACGPDPVFDSKDANTWFLSRLFKSAYSLFARQLSSESYMTTPFGSSTHFIPVKLTNKNRAICERIESGLAGYYNSVNYMLGNPFPDIAGSPVRNPFTGPFNDGERSHQTMADYVFANMNPEIYQPVGDMSGFPAWWSQNVRNPILPVWSNYNKAYDSFIQNKYLPKLFAREFRGGCRFAQDLTKSAPKVSTSEFEGLNSIPFATENGKEGAAKKESFSCTSSTAYRVADGYFLALEVELRNYLRGMYSLYTSTFEQNKVPPEAKAEFMELAEALVKGLQIVSPEVLQSSDFEKVVKQMEDDLAQLVELISTRIKASSKGDIEFRSKMLETFKEHVSKIMADERQQLEVVNQLDVLSATTRGPGKKLDTGTSANPLSRGRR